MILIPFRLQPIIMLVLAIILAIFDSRGFTQASNLGKCTKESTLDDKNRDSKMPEFPLQEDLRIKSSFIHKAHEILRNGLEEFLELKIHMDLGFYLGVMTQNNSYYDENGKIINSYNDVWSSIWKQYNETLCENYAAKQFENDKLDLCSVVRYLSHQLQLKFHHTTILERMGVALKIKKCDTCLPYNRNELGGTMICPLSPPDPSFDYSPCTISQGNVVCDQVPLEEVQKVFKRTSLPRLASVKLILRPYEFSETFIPKDVFGTKRILDILIQYPSKISINRSLSLQVDADAFRSTKNYTTNFEVNIIDCTLLDLGFLSGFEKLTRLNLYNIRNIQNCLPSFPPLPKLTTLEILYCTGMNEPNILPTLTNGLKVVRFHGDVNNIHTRYNNEIVDRFLDWLLLSSADILEDIGIVFMNQLNRIPHKITSFKGLRKLSLDYNNISNIKSGELAFSVPFLYLNIGENGIKEIEPGAFQGDFKDAEVYVKNNNLTRFEESVFGPMLQQMASGRGFIRASDKNSNPIDCSNESICHLAWLKNYEVDVKFSLKCSNGTFFKDLQPTGFNHCP